jgi:hypothetical protein
MPDASLGRGRARKGDAAADLVRCVDPATPGRQDGEPWGAPWAVAVLLLVGILAGCLSGPAPADERAIDAWKHCRAEPAKAQTLFFASGLALVPQKPTNPGAAPGNAFSSGFLTDDLKEWLSAPVTDGMWLVGDLTLEYWVRSTGSPAPLAIGGDTGEGYHFFNQVGSDRSFQPNFGREYSTAAPLPGTVDHYTETIPMPPGGFIVEAGDRVRVLLTDLAVDSLSADGPSSGHDVLFGGDTPSQIRFTARCFPRLSWPESDTLLDEDVVLQGNQGLLTGGVPPREGFNVQTFNVTIPEGTQRVSVRITQTSDPNPVKDDIDLTLLEVDGSGNWSIGSPYASERGALWQDNLAATFPQGRIMVQVNSYSGAAYEGRVVVTAERATLD